MDTEGVKVPSRDSSSNNDDVVAIMINNSNSFNSNSDSKHFWSTSSMPAAALAHVPAQSSIQPKRRYQYSSHSMMILVFKPRAHSLNPNLLVPEKEMRPEDRTLGNMNNRECTAENMQEVNIWDGS